MGRVGIWDNNFSQWATCVWQRRHGIPWHQCRWHHWSTQQPSDEHNPWPHRGLSTPPGSNSSLPPHYHSCWSDLQGEGRVGKSVNDCSNIFQLSTGISKIHDLFHYTLLYCIFQCEKNVPALSSPFQQCSKIVMQFKIQYTKNWQN